MVLLVEAVLVLLVRRVQVVMAATVVLVSSHQLTEPVFIGLAAAGEAHKGLGLLAETVAMVAAAQELVGMAHHTVLVALA